MNLKMPDISKEKAILPVVSVILGAVYLYFQYVFRPVNKLAYPDVENRIFTAFLILFIATILAYVREVYSFAKPAFSFLAAHFLKLHTRVKERTQKGMLMHAIAYLKRHFERGKPYYFVTLGFAMFLMLSPLVIYKQKDLAEPAVVIFMAFVALSYWKKLDDRAMIVTALLFLLSCPFLLIMKDDTRAELAAIYAYYALCAGVFLQIVDYLQNREKYNREEMAEDAHGQVQEVEEGCWKITLPVGKK